jgi:hypothetical protein
MFQRGCLQTELSMESAYGLTSRLPAETSGCRRQTQTLRPTLAWFVGTNVGALAGERVIEMGSEVTELSVEFVDCRSPARWLLSAAFSPALQNWSGFLRRETPPPKHDSTKTGKAEVAPCK